MTSWICETCGVQHADTAEPPDVCAICADERQYVPPGGQRWTSLAGLASSGYESEVEGLEPGLTGVGVSPAFGIGQRGLLVQTAAGNLLWDIPGYIDARAVARVRELGGVAAVAASHPHFYGVMAEWSHAFGGAPILVPEADRQWVMRPEPAVKLWSGTYEALPGVTLVQCGGHFDGSAVLHWAAGAGGAGALLTGDTVTVTPDLQHVSFMRSYPNLIPLPATAIHRIRAALAPYEYDRIYGGWWGKVVSSDAKAAVRRSAERYIAWLHSDEE